MFKAAYHHEQHDNYEHIINNELLVQKMCALRDLAAM